MSSSEDTACFLLSSRKKYSRPTLNTGMRVDVIENIGAEGAANSYTKPTSR